MFSGAGIWSREYINRASGSHKSSWMNNRRRERHLTTPSGQIKATACRQPVSRFRYSICLFILFISINEIKLNLLVSLIFLTITRLIVQSAIYLLFVYEYIILTLFWREVLNLVTICACFWPLQWTTLTLKDLKPIHKLIKLNNKIINIINRFSALGRSSVGWQAKT